MYCFSCGQDCYFQTFVVRLNIYKENFTIECLDCSGLGNIWGLDELPYVKTYENEYVFVLPRSTTFDF